ncbi:Putative protein without homology [Lacticaseibacillus rhamnosus GG]|nr:Putative protein without homology [Lacticaseibacillus rhamnosus GG]
MIKLVSKSMATSVFEGDHAFLCLMEMMMKVAFKMVTLDQVNQVPILRRLI